MVRVFILSGICTPILADGICDRTIYDSYTIRVEGDSMRNAEVSLSKANLCTAVVCTTAAAAMHHAPFLR